MEAGWKTLSKTELPGYKSNQHEINVLARNRKVFEPVSTGLQYSHFYFFDSTASASEFRFVDVFYYDSRENDSYRSPEYRLYYPASLDSEMERVQPGDMVTFIRNLDRSLLVVISPQGSRLTNEIQNSLSLPGGLFKSMVPQPLSQYLGLKTTYGIWNLKGFASLGTEQLGSKARRWFAPQQSRYFQFLYKEIRKNTGDVWIEKVCSELAHLISIPVAGTQMARYDDENCVLSERFVFPQGFPDASRRKGQRKRKFEQVISTSLIHGNEILHRFDPRYELGKTFGHSSHRLDTILTAVQHLTNSRELSLQLLRLFLFDCWIGNTDRHHENWGLIRNNLYSDEESFAITPAYDHGAALCSSLLPEAKQSLLTKGNIEKYYRKGASALYGSGKKTLKFTELADLCFQKERELTGSIRACAALVDQINNVDSSAILGILDKIPGQLMNEPDKEFTIGYLLVSARVLNEIKRTHSDLEG